MINECGKSPSKEKSKTVRPEMDCARVWVFVIQSPLIKHFTSVATKCESLEQMQGSRA